MATEFVHIVCPSCAKVNRVAWTRLTEGPKCGVCKERLFTAHSVELESKNFQQHIARNDIPVVVDFWAPWCGPCKMMAPAFERAAAHGEPQVRFGKVNTDNEPMIAQRFGIRSIPTLIVFKGGQEIGRQAGAMDFGTLVQWVQAHTADIPQA